jgi:hypothetical protein
LPGFEAARLLQTSAELKRVTEERAAAALEEAGEAVAPQVTALVEAFRRIGEAQHVVAAAIADCGSADHPAVYVCQWQNTTTASRERTATWYALSSRTRTALTRIKAEHENNENPAIALGRYLAVVPASDFAYDLPEELLRSRLRDFGLNPITVARILEKSPEARDDAELRAADEAARAIVGSLPEAAQEDEVPPRALAEAKVAFDQLVCHLEDNWLHYMQMVWLRENHDQRFLRLQALGPIATVIENELLGFHADKAAYPLRQTANLQSALDLDKVLAEARKEVEAEPPPPTLVSVPTPGVLLEAMTGQCDACEDFIRESRVIDLRAQEAKASQEEAEADRRKQRLAANDLSEPLTAPGKLVIEVQGLDGNEDGEEPQ